MRLFFIVNVVVVALASSCTSHSKCPSGNFCYHNGTCAAQVASGGSCDVLINFGDKHDTVCAGTVKCIEKVCQGLLGNGAACTSEDSCQSGFCTDAIADASPTCQPKVAVGGSCRDSDAFSPTQCTAGTYCMGAISKPGNTGTCTKQKSVDSACQNSVECDGLGDYGQCIENKCKDIGGAFVGAVVGLGATLIGVIVGVVIAAILCCLCCIYLLRKNRKVSDDD